MLNGNSRNKNLGASGSAKHNHKKMRNSNQQNWRRDVDGGRDTAIYDVNDNHNDMANRNNYLGNANNNNNNKIQSSPNGPQPHGSCSSEKINKVWNKSNVSYSSFNPPTGSTSAPAAKAKGFPNRKEPHPIRVDSKFWNVVNNNNDENEYEWTNDVFINFKEQDEMNANTIVSKTNGTSTKNGNGFGHDDI